MGAELTKCCGVDDDYYEQINTTKKGEEDETRDSERKKIKRKLKTILVHKDPEFAKYIKTEKYERLPGISPTKEEALLTAFAKNELTKEITWDILLAIASKKYGEMELKKLRNKKKGNTPKTPNPNPETHTNGATDSKEHKTEDTDTKEDSKETVAVTDTDNLQKYKNLRDSNDMLPLSTLTFRFPWDKLYKMIRPQSLTELESEMQTAVNKGKCIRAMGSRYAWTNITFTDGLLIDMYNSKLNAPKLAYDNTCFNKFGKDLDIQSNLLLSECGANIRDINDILWPRGRRKYLVNKQQSPYKMIPDTPGFDELCIGGLIQSGGYGIGTPYHYGSFVNHVRSFCMLIIDDKRKVRRIQVEPSPENGAIHDMYKWCRKYPNVQLIQNDSIFHALLVSMGVCGVMCSVFIELMDAHYLYERRFMMSWKQFKHKKWKSIDKKCKNGDIVRLQFYIAPYLTYDKRYRESPPVIINTYEYTEQMPKHGSYEKDAGQHRSRDTERSVILASLLATRYANKWPRLVPFILQMSMECTCHSGVVIPAIDAVLFGNSNIIPSHKSGFGMSANSFTAIGDDYIRLCNILRAKCSKQIITQPCAVRFSNPGFGLLNFTYNKGSVILEQSLYDFRNSIYFDPTEMMEHRQISLQSQSSDGSNQSQQLQICLTTTPKLWHTLFKLQELCMGEKYKGKPHLGLYFHVDQNIWKNHGASFNEFMEIYKKFNSHQIFCNSFTKESGLDKCAQFNNA